MRHMTSVESLKIFSLQILSAVVDTKGEQIFQTCMSNLDIFHIRCAACSRYVLRAHTYLAAQYTIQSPGISGSLVYSSRMS